MHEICLSHIGLCVLIREEVGVPLATTPLNLPGEVFSTFSVCSKTEFLDSFLGARRLIPPRFLSHLGSVTWKPCISFCMNCSLDGLVGYLSTNLAERAQFKLT